MKLVAVLVGAVITLVVLTATVIVVGLGVGRSVADASTEPGFLPEGQAAAAAEYDPVRLTVGLGAAAVLLVVAAWLVRTTDWSTVGEAAAPEIDGAAYADLDAIVADLADDESSMAVTRRGPPARLSE